MVVVPLDASETQSTSLSSQARRSEGRYWVRIAAAGTLAASGVLLMSGKRRAGLVAAAAATALTAVDQQDAVRYWWNRLPGYLDEVQSVLTQVQSGVEELSAQGERIRTILSR